MCNNNDDDKQILTSTLLYVAQAKQTCKTYKIFCVYGVVVGMIKLSASMIIHTNIYELKN